MTELPVVQYGGNQARIDLADQEKSMKYIHDIVIPSCIEDFKSIDSGVIAYRKITKNDNIKNTVEKLENLNCQYVCLYSYGPHTQKMLSIVEIFKRLILAKDSSLKQWNRLTCFTLTEQGRNELLEKQTRVPILITVLETLSEVSRISLEPSLKGFTRQ